MTFSDQRLATFYSFWVDVPNWRDASAYPAQSCALQWYGFEFLRRRQKFRDDLKQWLLDLPLEKHHYCYVSEDKKKWQGPPGFESLIPEWRGLRNWPHFTAADEIGCNGIVSLSFNLGHHIQEQVDRAADILRQWQQGHIENGAIPPLFNKRHTRELLPVYLRVLDAREAQASYEQIAEHLSLSMSDAIDANKVGGWLKAARRYRDHDFPDLLAVIE